MAELRRGEAVGGFLAIWFAAALLLTLAYPGRSPLDLTWVVLPLSALAARQIARLLQIPAGDRLPAAGQGVLTVVILAYLLMTAAGLSLTGVVSREAGLRLGAAALLLLLATALVGWGWSGRAAGKGFVLGLAVVLLALTVSAGWNAAGHSAHPGGELWSASAPPPEFALLHSTILDLNRWGPKEAGGLPIAVINSSSPALRWALRGFHRVSYVEQLPATASPSLVITPDQPDLALAATYRGQGFFLANEPVWQVLQPLDWFRWFLFRAVPPAAQVPNRLILWARLDVFPTEAGAQDAPLAPPAQSAEEPPQ